jgi:archaellum component FlaG (FlaF/FlaG flagellin family)
MINLIDYSRAISNHINKNFSTSQDPKIKVRAKETLSEMLPIYDKEWGRDKMIIASNDTWVLKSENGKIDTLFALYYPLEVIELWYLCRNEP